MDLSAVLAADLVEFCREVGLAPGSVAGPLKTLTGDLRRATDAYLGLQVVLLDRPYPLTLTAVPVGMAAEEIQTSLRLPWSVLELGLAGGTTAEDPASTLTLYAGRPGAFVDLAADLAYAWRTPESATPRPDPAAIRLDLDLRPTSLVSGLVGHTERSTINRAVGFLIGQGYDVDEAYRVLVSRADAEGSSVLEYAVALLRPER